MGFRVWGLGFAYRVHGLGFGAPNSFDQKVGEFCFCGQKLPASGVVSGDVAEPPDHAFGAPGFLGLGFRV